jgi:hypothetical protein
MLLFKISALAGQHNRVKVVKQESCPMDPQESEEINGHPSSLVHSNVSIIKSSNRVSLSLAINCQSIDLINAIISPSEAGKKQIVNSAS